MYAQREDLYDEANQPKGPRAQHKEGPVARSIEQETAKVPSDVFLWGAVGSMGLSAIMQIIGARSAANFVGLWVPTLLVFGLYNKIVKLLGSDNRAIT